MILGNTGINAHKIINALMISISAARHIETLTAMSKQPIESKIITYETESNYF